MDQKQRLIKLYETETDKIRMIKDDFSTLDEMSDEHLLVLIEKAQKLSGILKRDWKQICGDDIERKSVTPILVRRKELKEDYAQMENLRKEIADLENEITEARQDLRHYRGERNKYRRICRNKMILAVSFGAMAVCSLIVHLLFLIKYHNIIIPEFILMLAIPFGLCCYFSISFMKASAREQESTEFEMIQQDVQDMTDDLEQKKELLEYYNKKYKTAYSEMDEYETEAYPYVEQILNKIEKRADYTRAANEYAGIMEILQFKQPDVYRYIPEIFFMEKEQNEFLEAIQEKMRQIDEYLVQTIETA